jgi:hypothetical protein
MLHRIIRLALIVGGLSGCPTAATSSTPDRYFIRTDGGDSRLTFSTGEERILCDLASPKCGVSRLTPAQDGGRYRQATYEVDITPYILVPNTLSITPLGPKDGTFPLKWELIQKTPIGRELTLREGVLEPGKASMEIPLPERTTCSPPELPTGEVLLSFLDPLPEAIRTHEYRFYSQLWPTPDDEVQESRRKDSLATFRSLSFIHLRREDKLQDHRSAPLRVRYDCKARVAMVYPEDGAELVAFGAWSSEAEGRVKSEDIATSNYEILKPTDDGWRILPLEEAPR